MTAKEAFDRYYTLLESLPSWPSPQQRLELAEAGLEYEKAKTLEAIRHEPR